MRKTYFIFDRMFYLMKAESFRLKEYMQKFEISRSSAFRDMDHLKTFYDVEFVYNTENKKYERR